MKNYKFTAILLCTAMLMASAAGCKKDEPTVSITSDSLTVNDDISNQAPTNSENNTGSENSTSSEVGKNEIKAEIADETDENDTIFKLNSVLITSEPQESSMGERNLVFLDVTITNSTDTSYDISSLNNLMLILPDNTEVLSHIEGKFYAEANFKENMFFADPINIPANGTFSGIIGGFRVPPEIDNFTICFFPTGENPRNKESVIKIDVTSDDIQKLSSDILK